MDEIKDLLYELAVGIVDLFHENAKLKAENKRLQKDIDERIQLDRQIFQNQMNAVGETLKAFCDRADRESENESKWTNNHQTILATSI